jgi:hypothetical protein
MTAANRRVEVFEVLKNSKYPEITQKQSESNASILLDKRKQTSGQTNNH